MITPLTVVYDEAVKLPKGWEKKAKKLLSEIGPGPFGQFFCDCGAEIPRGYGYTLGRKVNCFTCGRINQRKIQ